MMETYPTDVPNSKKEEKRGIENITEEASIDANLGRVISIMRTYSGATRGDMADALSISENHLREIEAGRRTPSIKVLNAIAKFLGIKVKTLLVFCEDEDLLREIDPKAKVSPVKFRQSMLKLLQRLTKEG